MRAKRIIPGTGSATAEAPIAGTPASRLEDYLCDAARGRAADYHCSFELALQIVTTEYQTEEAARRRDRIRRAGSAPADG